MRILFCNIAWMNYYKELYGEKTNRKMEVPM